MKEKGKIIDTVEGIGFNLILEGYNNVLFTEAAGLDAEATIRQYRSEDHKIFGDDRPPEIVHNENVTLRGGMIKREDLSKGWFATKSSLESVLPQTLSIQWVDQERNPLIIWTLNNARPVNIEMGDDSMSGNEVAITAIELAHEGMSLHEF